MNDALVVGLQVPERVSTGEEFQAAVAVRNTGTSTWSREAGHFLGSEAPRDNFVWGTNRMRMGPEDQVAPGQEYTFEATLTAPAQAGTHEFRWQMLQDAVEWFGEVSPERTIEVVAVEAPRTPDPAPGERLPLPDRGDVVEALAAEHPQALAESCVEDGGDNEFLDLVVDRLRLEDTRWGYNWKRGNVGDLSQDVVDYHFGAGESEGSTDVYIIDMIVGHCGDDPRPGWGDQTQATEDAGTIGRWTGNGRF